jgi:hypothetical protein
MIGQSLLRQALRSYAMFDSAPGLFRAPAEPVVGRIARLLYIDDRRSRFAQTQHHKARVCIEPAPLRRFSVSHRVGGAAAQGTPQKQ